MLTKLYKLIFDLSISYTIGAFLLYFLGGISIEAGGYLILLLTVMVSTLLERKKSMKFLALFLLPLGSLILITPSTPELIVFLLIWAYATFVMFTERYAVSRGEFIDMLKRLVYLAPLFLYFIFTGMKELGFAIDITGPYIVASLVSASFLLRHLRAVHQMEQIKQYRRQQFMELMIFLIICSLLTLAKAPQNLAEGFLLMYQALLRPILTVFAGILGALILGIIQLLLALIGLVTKNKEIRSMEAQVGDAADQSLQLIEGVGRGIEWIKPFLYSVGIIIGLVILFFFFRWLMGERYKQKLPVGILETREAIEGTKERRRDFKRRRPKDPREAVRYYYGKYLLWLQHQRVTLQPNDTTEEIDVKYQNALIEDRKAKREASKELRLLYRRSRYRMTDQITIEEAKKAEQLYQTIKNSKLSAKG